MKKLSISSIISLVLITLLTAAVSFGFLYFLASRGVALCDCEIKTVYDAARNSPITELSIVPNYPGIIAISATVTIGVAFALGFELFSEGTDDAVGQMARIARSDEEGDGDDDDDSFLEPLVFGYVVHEILSKDK